MILRANYIKKINNYKMSFSMSSIIQLISILLPLFAIIQSNLQNELLGLFLIFLCLLLMAKPVYILPPLFVTSLLGNFFVALPGFSLSQLLTIAFIFASFIKFIFNKIKIDYGLFIMVFFLCVFNWFSALTSITGNLTSSIIMGVNIIMFFFIANSEVEDIDLFMRFITLCVLIMSTFIFFMTIFGITNEINTRLTLVGSNANSLGMALAQFSAFLIGEAMISKRTLEKILYNIFICLNMSSLFMTGSRSALIGVLGAFICVSIINIIKRGGVIKKITSLILTICALIATFYWCTINTPELFSRFSLTDINESGGSGREIIWSILIDYIIPNNILLGVGLGGDNIAEAVALYMPFPHGAHNILLSMLTMIGVIGTVVYFTLFFKCMHVFIKACNENVYALLPLMMVLTAFINGIGEDVWMSRLLWFGLGLGLMLLHKSLYMKNYKHEYVKLSGSIIT